eukprot:8948695-Pyramimonas_sp.AAC.1
MSSSSSSSPQPSPASSSASSASSSSSMAFSPAADFSALVDAAGPLIFAGPVVVFSSSPTCLAMMAPVRGMKVYVFNGGKFSSPGGSNL